MELTQEEYRDFLDQLCRDKVIDKNFNEMVRCLYLNQAIAMQRLEKKLFDYIYYNFDKIKFTLQIYSISDDIVFTLSRRGNMYARDKLGL